LVPLKKVLVLATSASQLNELMRGARSLRKAGYEVCFASDNGNSATIGQLRAIIEGAGFGFFDLPDAPPNGSSEVIRRNRVRIGVATRLVKWLTEPTQLKGRLAKRLLGWDGTDEALAKAIKLVDIIWRIDEADLIRFDAFLNDLRPVALLIAEDGIGGNAAMIAAAKSKGVLVVDVPYEYSNKEQLLRGIAPNGPDLIPLEPVLRRWFPKWMLRNEPPVLTAFPPNVALAREAQGLAPLIPTTVHGGYADKLAVESRLMREHYRREGLPESKLADVGMLALDDVLETMSSEPAHLAAFKSGRKIQPGRTAVLCSFVPDYVEASGDRCEFTTYRDLLDFWIDTVLETPNVDVVFQAHPAVLPDARKHIASRVSLSGANLTTLLPACDVYITSVSSTIRWAIASRKPVVNYDVYRFNYPDYVNAPGVTNVTAKAEFIGAVRSLCADGAAYDAASAALAGGHEGWGILDGQAGARLARLIDEAVGAQP
jgi:hypothetical protein